MASTVSSSVSSDRFIVVNPKGPSWLPVGIWCATSSLRAVRRIQAHCVTPGTCIDRLVAGPTTHPLQP